MKNRLEDIMLWVKEKSAQVNSSINKCSLSDSYPWYYDEKEGCIRNVQQSFFEIVGIEGTINGNETMSQPIIVQKEIGYLGMLMRITNGVSYFLIQTKIEPGNINKVQLSPTLQATKSNFTQKHGGKKPRFLELFLQAKPENIVVDQIQSEQSSRFLRKRNRNIIVLTDSYFDEDDNYRWLSLKEIKELMRYDNIVNMDTCTVLSHIPFAMKSGSIPHLKKENEYPSQKNVVEIFNYINNYKMHNRVEKNLVPLYSLKNWMFNSSGEFVCKSPFPFKIVFCDISIEGREVNHWHQPLFESEGIATYGLLYKRIDNNTLFLVQAKPEIGCFDDIELGPSVQLEYNSDISQNPVTILFNKYCIEKKGIRLSVLLSEEGGRFYHEQNRNIIMEIDKDELNELPEGYFWCSYTTLNMFCQVNNILNIQLRKLLSLLDEDII